MSDFTHSREFPNTRWSIVAHSADANEETRREALEILCKQYWPPVFAFVRSKGHSPHDAQDITQGFFASFLAREDFSKVTRNKGKLRSFLLASAKNFMANEWRKSTRKKRSGDQKDFSLDQEIADGFQLPEPRDETTPETIYEQQWVMTLLGQVLQVLSSEYHQRGKGELFDLIKSTLSPGAPVKPYAEISQTLGISQSSVKVSVLRLRKRYQTLLRSTVADTLDPAEDLETELQYLKSVFN